MTLASSSRLGPYEILSPLGAGGMGEVYRARDTKLNREVAIKVLPETYRVDPDRLARLTHEAQVLASLNHQNIAAIHGFEQSNDVTALVLELVEGPTLAERLEQGPIALDEALPIARQIAEALEAAHERGIIHRDLKPANVKLRADGTVKVLDFGLAKSLAPMGLSGDLTQSPTVLSPAPTLAGVILGTAAYMAPEQARGKAVDNRTDIWAFGCVLYEMLTGSNPFARETVTDTVAAILNNETDWQALPHGTPIRIRSLIARCLKKDPAQRLRDIADGRFQIEEALNDPASSASVQTPARRHREWAAWIAAALILGGALLLYARRPSTTSSPADAVSFPVFPPAGTVLAGAFNTTVNVPAFALSPDGRALVFSAQAAGAGPVLWVRSLDQIKPRQLAGTEDAQDPFWSPDSRWIGFVADGKLKKVPAGGGATQVITETSTDFRGATWSSDDTIIFGGGRQPILSVNAAGGRPTPVTVIDVSLREGSHRNPHVLPDGRHFLYSIFSGRPDQSGVYLGSLDGKTKKLLIHARTTAVYAPPGHLLFVDGDALLGQAFDAERLELKGQPFLVADQAGRNTAFMSAVSASRTGAIAYAGTLSQIGRLAWIDRQGNPVGSPGTPEGDFTDFRLSSDETRLAASVVNPKSNAVEISLIDLARGSTSRVASEGLITSAALWSPDGARLIFRTNRAGIVELYERSAAGGGDDRPVLSEDAYRTAPLSQNVVPTDWSPDGSRILFSAASLGSGTDLWLLPVGGKEPPAKFVASPADEMHGNFSPDGRLIAYTSNESGRFEVYVETFPRSDRKWSVSTNSGYQPRWRPDGREIYYLSNDRTLMAVSVAAGPSFGIPKPLFQTRAPAGVTANRTHYVPSRDGQRFLVDIATDQAPSPITVVLNWTAALKK
jgi:eukaryotic-like serine/threonine-protein kinase